MSKREARTAEDPILRQVATRVEDVYDKEIQQLITDCIDTMYAEDLAGYAAPQLGESVRVFVTELRETKYRKGINPTPLTVYINPKITSRSPETELGWEGCGSIPDVFGQVERSKDITVTYTNQNGKLESLDASGLLARVIQHEYDHLEGILFTDLADPKSLISREEYSQITK